MRQKLRDEGISYLPPTLALRKEREDALAAIAGLTSEARVRELLEDLNERIRTVNRRPEAGPPSTVALVDVEAVVSKWRADQRPAEVQSASSPEERAPLRRRRRLRRIFKAGEARGR